MQRRLTRRELTLCIGGALVALVVVVDKLIVPAGLSWSDLSINFGEKTFATITRVDSDDCSVMFFDGIMSVEDGQLTTTIPGAVYIVGLPKGISCRGKQFDYREILLLNSAHEVVLAPPGLTLTIPREVEVLGRKFTPGQFVVPHNSKVPDAPPRDT
jgi:hypothetical protein